MIDRTEDEIMRNWKNNLSRPLVSICTITYDHEKFIEEALDSFLMQQTDFPFEIVIDDDASKDKTPEIIGKYAEKYPKIINANLRKKNIGSKKNYLYNLSRAEGKYIAICEGDDYWIDECKLKKQTDFLEKNNDYVMIAHNVLSIDFSNPDKFFLSRNQNIKERDFTLIDMISMNPIPSLTKMFRNNYVNEIPGIFDDIFMVDRIHNILLSQYGKCKFINQITGVYRKHSEGISDRFRQENYKSKLFFYDQEEKFLYACSKYFSGMFNDEIDNLIEKLNYKKMKLALKNLKIDIAIKSAKKIQHSKEYKYSAIIDLLKRL